MQQINIRGACFVFGIVNIKNWKERDAWCEDDLQNMIHHGDFVFGVIVNVNFLLCLMFFMQAKKLLFSFIWPEHNFPHASCET